MNEAVGGGDAGGKSLRLRGNGRSLHFCITRMNERTNERTDPAWSVEATDGNTRFICKFHICRRERRRPPRRAAPSLLERSHGGFRESASLLRRKIHVEETQLVHVSTYFKDDYYSISWSKKYFFEKSFICIFFNCVMCEGQFLILRYTVLNERTLFLFNIPLSLLQFAY